MMITTPYIKTLVMVLIIVIDMIYAFLKALANQMVYYFTSTEADGLPEIKTLIGTL